MTYNWWNNYNLGDCFWHCMYMRKIAIRQPDDLQVLHCRSDHHAQLKDVICDLPNIRLETWQPGTHQPAGSIACWIGNYHREHALRNDIIGFLVDWFDHLSEAAKVVNPIRNRRHLLADYPACFDHRCVPAHWHGADWLVINSHPMSGQFAHDPQGLYDVITRMRNKGLTVVTTCPVNVMLDNRFCTMLLPNGPATVSQIGAVSQFCLNILAVATGPIWPTFNIWNQRAYTHRIILLNDIHINYGDKLPHFGSVSAATNYLEAKGVI